MQHQMNEDSLAKLLTAKQAKHSMPVKVCDVAKYGNCLQTHQKLRMTSRTAWRTQHMKHLPAPTISSAMTAALACKLLDAVWLSLHLQPRIKFSCRLLRAAGAEQSWE